MKQLPFQGFIDTHRKLPPCQPSALAPPVVPQRNIMHAHSAEHRCRSTRNTKRQSGPSLFKTELRPNQILTAPGEETLQIMEASYWLVLSRHVAGGTKELNKTSQLLFYERSFIDIFHINISLTPSIHTHTHTEESGGIIWCFTTTMWLQSDGLTFVSAKKKKKEKKAAFHSEAAWLKKGDKWGWAKRGEGRVR